jgi:N-acetylmuramoyl-L-alanine amidase
MKKSVKQGKRQVFLFSVFILLFCVMSSSVSTADATTLDTTRTYTVKAGDTLWRISQTFKIDVDELKRVNQLNSNIIQIGQSLIIPQQTDDARYVVQRGDSLWTISRRFGITVQELKTANRLSSDVLQIGQILVIPQTSGSAIAHAQQKSATVQVAAVAENEAQISYSREEFEWLTKIIEAEAGNQPYEGRVAVGSVVINRVHSDQFPDSIRQVIFQKTRNVYQFTPVGNGRIYRVTPSEDSIKAAKAALEGEDPTNGALFFYNPKISRDRWIRSRTVAVQIGQHTFAY